MFPNFKSLADKRRQRERLLKQIEYDENIEDIKNMKYAETDWATDQANRLALLQSTTASLPTTSLPTKKTAIATQTEMDKDDGDSLGNIDIDMENVEYNEGQEDAKNHIEFLYTTNPKLVMKMIAPSTMSGHIDADVYIGENGKLFNVRDNKISRKKGFLYDWIKTLDRIEKIANSFRKNIRAVEQEVRTKDKDTDGAAEAYSKALLLEIMNTNNIDDVEVNPAKKQLHPKSGAIWPMTTYYINKDGKIYDKRTGKEENEKAAKISWSNTLQRLVDKLIKNKIPFKQSKQFITSKKRDATPINLKDLQDGINDKSTQYNELEIAKQKVVDLYKNNPWLTNYYISPIPINGSYDVDTYYLSYLATIYNRKKKSQLSGKRMKQISDLTDWEAVFENIVSDYVRGIYDNNTLYESENKIIEPTNIKDEDVKMFSNRFNELAGIGISTAGRRSMLNNERHKLQGEIALGNKHKKLRHELALLNQYEKK